MIPQEKLNKQIYAALNATIEAPKEKLESLKTKVLTLCENVVQWE